MTLLVPLRSLSIPILSSFATSVNYGDQLARDGGDDDLKRYSCELLRRGSRVEKH